MAGEGRDPKRNPIAGILQKELGITTQQGRKILEQRQKIRDVSSNLKEVSLCAFVSCSGVPSSNDKFHLLVFAVPRSARQAQRIV